MSHGLFNFNIPSLEFGNLLCFRPLDQSKEKGVSPLAPDQHTLQDFVALLNYIAQAFKGSVIFQSSTCGGVDCNFIHQTDGCNPHGKPRSGDEYGKGGGDKDDKGNKPKAPGSTDAPTFTPGVENMQLNATDEWHWCCAWMNAMANGVPGIEVHLEISARSFERLKDRRRSMTGRTGCGKTRNLSLTHKVIVDL